MHCLFCAAFTALCTVCLCSAHWWDDAPSILCCIHCIMHCVSVRYVLMGWCTVYFVLHSLHNALCTMWIVLYCTARCLLLPRVCSFALKLLSVSTTLLHYVAFKYNLLNLKKTQRLKLLQNHLSSMHLFVCHFPALDALQRYIKNNAFCVQHKYSVQCLGNSNAFKCCIYLQLAQLCIRKKLKHLLSDDVDKNPFFV